MDLRRAALVFALAGLWTVATACGETAQSPGVTSTLAPSASSTPAAPAITVTGLFSEPRPSPPDESGSLGAKPSIFAPWDGSSTVIYDVEAGVVTDLGRGSIGRFSPDSTRMVWIADPTAPFGTGDARIIDLRTMEQRSLGPGRLARFVDDTHVVVVPEGNDSEIIDLESGDRTPVSGLPHFQPSYVVMTEDGQELRRTLLNENDQARSRFTLTGAAGRVLLEFEAWHAKPAGPGTLIVATVAQPVPGDVPTPTIAGYVPQTTNIFLVDIASGRATFVATSPAHGPNWPLIADGRYVAWTEGYCAPAPGRTRIFDRRSGAITEIDASLWLDEFTPGGLIAAGPFGAKELIDPETWQYTAVLPGSGDASWSPDYRYAAMEIIGHGGLCG